MNMMKSIRVQTPRSPRVTSLRIPSRYHTLVEAVNAEPTEKEGEQQESALALVGDRLPSHWMEASARNCHRHPGVVLLSGYGPLPPLIRLSLEGSLTCCGGAGALWGGLGVVPGDMFGLLIRCGVCRGDHVMRHIH